MANILSEQIDLNLRLEIAPDQALSAKKNVDTITTLLGVNNCKIEDINGKRILVYSHENIKEYLLLASITYLGGNGQHPVFKKRMQLKKWYKDICSIFEENNNANVRFLGTYHYKGNIIFVDFVKDTYLRKKMNSSAAHVYTNDFYQAMINGIFKKKDRNNNEIIVIRENRLKTYLDGKESDTNKLCNFFVKFNNDFNFGEWLMATDVIPEMYESKWKHWKQGEWPGWYLEYRISEFIREYGFEKTIKYVGSSNKKEEDLDFDFWCGENNFFADVKSSNINSIEFIGNDQENFLNCINKYGKFWYLIYEHETIKDSLKDDFSATRFRNNYIKNNNEWDSKKEWDELSYHKRMKHSVKFMRMSIIEINKINYKSILTDFKQGKQQTGHSRNLKFKLSKSQIGNCVIFSYLFQKQKI